MHHHLSQSVYVDAERQPTFACANASGSVEYESLRPIKFSLGKGEERTSYVSGSVRLLETNLKQRGPAIRFPSVLFRFAHAGVPPNRGGINVETVP